MEVKGCSLVAQTHNSRLKIANEFTVKQKKIYIRSGKGFDQKTLT
jgi:hypothetical protein